MNGHLVAVEVRVECGADQRRNFNGLSFHQNRFKRLDAEAMQRWSAVQEHRMILDHFLEDIPHNRFLPFHHLFRTFDGGRVPFLLQPVINEWLE